MREAKLGARSHNIPRSASRDALQRYSLSYKFLVLRTGFIESRLRRLRGLNPGLTHRKAQQFLMLTRMGGRRTHRFLKTRGICGLAAPVDLKKIAKAAAIHLGCERR
jgi:hypothetical protein